MDVLKNMLLPIGTTVRFKKSANVAGEYKTRGKPFTSDTGNVWVALVNRRPALLLDLVECTTVMADAGPENVDGCGAPA